MKLDKEDYAVLGVGALCLVLVAVIMWYTYEEDAACAARGGVTVRSLAAVVCIKGEVL